MDNASGATVFDSTAHRKIRLYVELGDDVDNTGHGTHTMGTLVGSPYDISNVKAVDHRSALAALADPSEPPAAQQPCILRFTHAALLHGLCTLVLAC